MADRYYTLMLIPEQTNKVKKVLIPVRLMRIFAVVLGVVVVASLTAFFFTVRYFQEASSYRMAVAKSRTMENDLRLLQNKLASSEQALLRVRNLEQKLRVILQAQDVNKKNTGIGPLTRNEENVLNAADSGMYSGGAGVAGGGFADWQATSTAYRVQQLQNRAVLQEQSLQELYELLQDQKTLLAATPSIWPAKGWLTSGFGYRISPFTGTSQFHEGIDIANNMGTPIRATADGVVVSVKTHVGYGKMVVIDHGYGVVTRYGHCSEIFVKPGMKVKRGDVIASMGNTGRSTGPHLHYEVRVNGVAVNPMRYILDY